VYNIDMLFHRLFWQKATPFIQSSSPVRTLLTELHHLTNKEWCVNNLPNW